MSAEYSVDGILAVAEAADNGDVRHPGMVADMLTAFANRIEAAEMAVPVGEVSEDYSLCGGRKVIWSTPADKSTECCRLPVGTKLFTHPPAQAAQKGWSLFTGTIGGVHVGLHGTKESVEALDAFLATQPHSPNAADSGRVTQAMVDAAQFACGGDKGAYWAPETDADWVRAITAALAAQPQPAASPVGVPDGWVLVPMKATKEMLEVPASIVSAYAASRIWEKMIEAAPSAPEGGEVE